MTKKVKKKPAMVPNCDLCKKAQGELGALLFSPPQWSNYFVEKFHVCVKCYERIKP